MTSQFRTLWYSVLLAVGVLAIGTTTLAATVEVLAPCGGAPIAVASLSPSLGNSVGSLTVQVLSEAGVPFQGTDAGMNSIAGSPTGDAALEIISDREMRAYGWCYQVNGIEPGLFAHQVFIGNESDLVTWFFGYAWYKDGEWIAMCIPTASEKPAHVCSS